LIHASRLFPAIGVVARRGTGNETRAAKDGAGPGAWATPNAKLRGFRWVTPGCLVAMAAWVLASAAFATYVANFGSYDKTYGTLGGLVALLVWLWISNLAILFGHQLNAERERSAEIEEGTPRAESEIQLEPRAAP
jgi:membrane protein